MATFLTEKSLTGAIRRIVNRSTDVRLAVAFWGEGAAKRLSLGKAWKGRILCNLRSGACNPAEVRRLMKMLQARTHDRLHAKVYWTPSCAIVGSSNASTNGLVVAADTSRGWREANLLVDDPSLLKQIGDWFDERWNESNRITKDMLLEAKEKWDRRARETSRMSIRGNTLLSSALAEPRLFKDQDIYLAIYPYGLSREAKQEERKLRQSNKTKRMKDGTTVWFKRVSLFEGWDSIPAGAWLLDCSLINRSKPRVWGIWRVPDPIAPISLKDSEAIIAFKQPGVRIPGRLLRLPPMERRLIEKNMERLSAAASRRGADLLHLSDAARIIRRGQR